MCTVRLAPRSTRCTITNIMTIRTIMNMTIVMRAGAEHDHVHSAHEGHEHSEDEHLEASHASDEIIFPAEQAARVDFEVSEVMPADFSSVIKCSGEILSAQDDSSPLSAPVSGIVRFAVSPFADGSAVAAGRPGTLHRFQIGGRGRCQRKGFCGI